MAYPIELTIGTGNKVTLNYQSQEVSVSLTYRLERDDTDALVVAREKAHEVVAVHRAAWESVREAKPAAEPKGANPVPAPKPNPSAPQESDRTPNCEADQVACIQAETNASQRNETAKAKAKAKAKKWEPSTLGQRAALRALLNQSGASEEGMQKSLVIRYGCESLEDLSFSQASEWLLELQRSERERVRSHRNSPNPSTCVLNGKETG